MASSRDRFLDTVRAAVRSGAGADAASSDEASAISAASDIDERAADVLEQAARNRHGLLLQLRESAERAGAVVSIAGSVEEAAEYVVSVTRNIEARSVVRSGHDVLDRLGIDDALAAAGVEVTKSSAPEQGDRQSRVRSSVSRPQGLTSASPAWTTPSPRPGAASSSPAQA